MEFLETDQAFTCHQIWWEALIIIMEKKYIDGEQIKKIIRLDFSHIFYFKKITLLKPREGILGQE